MFPDLTVGAMLRNLTSAPLAEGEEFKRSFDKTSPLVSITSRIMDWKYKRFIKREVFASPTRGRFGSGALLHDRVAGVEDRRILRKD